MKEKDSPQNEKKKKSANQEITSLFISKTCKQLVHLNIKNTYNPREEKKLGQRVTWIFLPKRQPGCHWAGEKMLNITNYQREGNRRSKWSLPSFCSERPSSRRPARIRATKSRGRGTPLHPWWGCKSLQEWWEITRRILQEPNIRKPHGYGKPTSRRRSRKKIKKIYFEMTHAPLF